MKHTVDKLRIPPIISETQRGDWYQGLILRIISRTPGTHGSNPMSIHFSEPTLEQILFWRCFIPTITPFQIEESIADFLQLHHPWNLSYFALKILVRRLCGFSTISHANFERRAIFISVSFEFKAPLEILADRFYSKRLIYRQWMSSLLHGLLLLLLTVVVPDSLDNYSSDVPLFHSNVKWFEAFYI